jgi:hypothetical protein
VTGRIVAGGWRGAPPTDHRELAMQQTPLTLITFLAGVLFGAGTVRFLPKDLDITIVFTAASLFAALGGFLWAVRGRDWQCGALLGARWGALVRLLYFLVGLITGVH